MAFGNLRGARNARRLKMAPPRWLGVLVLAMCAACSKSPPDSPPATPSASTSATAAPKGESPTAAAPGPTTLAVASATSSANAPSEAPVEAPPLGADESEGARPSDTPKAEAVLDAVEKSGLKLGERKHLVASIFGARFCLTAKTDDGLALSACEYESEDAAKRGKDRALTMLGALPPSSQRAAAATNKKSVLVVRLPNPSPPSAAASTKKAIAAFSGM